MGVNTQLAVLTAALLLPALVLGRWMLAAGESVQVPEPLLPAVVEPWSATRDEALGEEVLELIEPDAHLMRLYEADGRTPIWVYVGVYAGRAGTGKSAHVPEACYPAQGWEALSSESLDLHLASGEELTVQKLEFHREAAREKVLYWFQPAGRWPVGGALEQLLRVVDSVQGRPQYAFVRISVRLDGDPAAARDLEAFTAEIAPAVRRLVESVRRSSRSAFSPPASRPSWLPSRAAQHRGHGLEQDLRVEQQ
jgi:EpsI family protein